MDEELGSYIWISKDMFDDWIFKFDGSDYGLAWISILLKAEQKEDSGWIPYQTFTLGFGQVYFNMRMLVGQWGWSKYRINKFLKLLEQENMITIKSWKSYKTSNFILTVCNFEQFIGEGD